MSDPGLQGRTSAHVTASINDSSGNVTDTNSITIMPVPLVLIINDTRGGVTLIILIRWLCMHVSAYDYFESNHTFFLVSDQVV